MQFHIIKAALLESSNELQEAYELLTRAMNIPGVKTVDAKNAKPVPLGERVEIFLSLARVAQVFLLCLVFSGPFFQLTRGMCCVARSQLLASLGVSLTVCWCNHIGYWQDLGSDDAHVPSQVQL